MENITNKTVPDAKIKIITSKNSPELAKKMKEASAYFMEIAEKTATKLKYQNPKLGIDV
mgnify:CR=1 FL=1